MVAHYTLSNDTSNKVTFVRSHMSSIKSNEGNRQEWRVHGMEPGPECVHGHTTHCPMRPTLEPMVEAIMEGTE